MMNEALTRNAGQTERKETGIIDLKRVGNLAQEEFSRKMVSYAVTAIMVVFFGFVISSAFSSVIVPLDEGARGLGWSVDLIFLAIIAVLSVNVFSRNYFLLHRDPFRNWLVFLRSLPIPLKEMVLARSAIMLAATLVMTALFFAPVVALSWSLMDDFDAGRFLWFGLVWLGYALFSGGINLFLELGVSGKVTLAIQFIEVVALIAIIWLTGGNVVLTTFELAREYGPLASGIALLIGGLVFALLAKATERRVAKREFAS